MLPDGFSSDRLILRPIEAADAAAIFTGYAQDPEVARYVRFTPHQSLADTDAYIARCLATPTTAARTYVLVDSTDRAVIGALICVGATRTASIAATFWRNAAGGEA